MFAPTANYNGSGFLSLAVNDQGNSGLGGPLADGPDLTTITITAVNDLPSGANSAVSMPQDTGRAFSVADFGFSDGDAGDTLSGVRIDALSLPPGATLQLSGANVTAGQVIAAAQLGNLVFAPAPGMSGVNYASFTFSVQDTNGPAFAASANTLTVNVTPVGTPGITVTPTAGLVTTESGGTATFSVVLDTQPLADVVITLSSSDATEGTVAPLSLTFTSADWNVVADGHGDAASADALADGNVALHHRPRARRQRRPELRRARCRGRVGDQPRGERPADRHDCAAELHGHRGKLPRARRYRTRRWRTSTPASERDRDALGDRRAARRERSCRRSPSPAPARRSSR